MFIPLTAAETKEFILMYSEEVDEALQPVYYYQRTKEPRPDTFDVQKLHKYQYHSAIHHNYNSICRVIQNNSTIETW